jgi:hypothetical protein
MKKILILCLLFVCLQAFPQQKITPGANSIGFIGTLSTLAEYFTEYDLFVNPGVGIGFRYHASDFLLLEFVLCGGFQIIKYSDEPENRALHLGGGMGVFYWINTANDFSLFLGPQVDAFFHAESEYPTKNIRIIGSFLCGAQYSFSKHFAVFGRVGLGVEFFQKTDAGDETDFFTYIRIVTPSIGFAFYL